MNGGLKLWKRMFQFSLIGISTGLYVKENAFTIYLTRGSSMEPTIPDGGICLVSRFNLDKLQLKDIIVAYSPVHEQRIMICKRIKALEGYNIVVDNQFKNIPRGHLYLEGDNQQHSTDSRFFGPIPSNLVRGKVVAVLYPFNRFRIFS